MCSPTPFDSNNTEPHSAIESMQNGADGMGVVCIVFVFFSVILKVYGAAEYGTFTDIKSKFYYS